MLNLCPRLIANIHRKKEAKPTRSFIKSIFIAFLKKTNNSNFKFDLNSIKLVTNFELNLTNIPIK